jgi:hypothetical protein
MIDAYIDTVYTCASYNCNITHMGVPINTKEEIAFPS